MICNTIRFSFLLAAKYGIAAFTGDGMDPQVMDFCRAGDKERTGAASQR